MAIKTEIISIRVSPEEKEKIKRMAEKQDITVSKLLYKVIIKELNNYGDYNAANEN